MIIYCKDFQCGFRGVSVWLNFSVRFSMSHSHSAWCSMTVPEWELYFNLEQLPVEYFHWQLTAYIWLNQAEWVQCKEYWFQDISNYCMQDCILLLCHVNILTKLCKENLYWHRVFIIKFCKPLTSASLERRSLHREQHKFIHKSRPCNSRSCWQPITT